MKVSIILDRSKIDGRTKVDGINLNTWEEIARVDTGTHRSQLITKARMIVHAANNGLLHGTFTTSTGTGTELNLYSYINTNYQGNEISGSLYN